MIPGYPPHLWIEPHREVVYRICWGGVAFFRVSIEDKLIAAAEELVKQGWVKADNPYWTAGLWYRRYLPTEKLKVRELRYAY